ncbi:hypothetical protein K501DRAFT_283683 [Backusella circina FSU 941]|nr:hypothetical protein K501DRAFT_283683 [Backusella circina FSU 941]
MPKGRNLKAKLKKNYQKSSPTPNAETRPTTVESVSDKINRLRIEHLRASDKPLRQQVLVTKHKPISRTPGPPPPPSWLVSNVATSNKIHYKTRYDDNVTDTLSKQCAAQVAKSLPSYLSAIPDLPVRTRQLILRYARDLDDTCFSAFVAFDYGDLQLIDSGVTFNRFLKWLWRVDPIQEQELFDDWEDQLDDDNGMVKYKYDPFMEDDSRENVDTKDERTFHIQHIITVIQGRTTNKPFMLYTPLSMKLVSLNISFPKKTFPNITLAHLLINTLPNLRQLGTASVFTNVMDGPRAISLIANGLVKLEEWDIGYHEWLTGDLIFGKLVHWNTDLRRLIKLMIRGIEDAEQLALDFKDAGYKFDVVF